MQTDIFWTPSCPFSCDYSFWLRDLKFYMCIKDPINKTCWKNGKDLSNGAPKNKLWNHTKKYIFWFLPKISAGHGWSWKFFLANFQILGPLGCQGWVVIPQNVKKTKITAPSVWLTQYISSLCRLMPLSGITVSLLHECKWDQGKLLFNADKIESASCNAENCWWEDSLLCVMKV